MNLVAFLYEVDTGDPAAALHARMNDAKCGICRFSTGAGGWQGYSVPALGIAGYGQSPQEAADALVRDGYRALEKQAFAG